MKTLLKYCNEQKVYHKKLINKYSHLGEKNTMYASSYAKYHIFCDIIERIEALILPVVGVTLPTKEEINIRLKTVVEQVFEENQTIEKKEYSSGFISCYYWLKIRQMSNGN